MLLTLVLLAQVVTPTVTPRPVHAPATLGGNPAPQANSLAGAAKGRKINTAAFSGTITTGTYSKPIPEKTAVNGTTDLQKQETKWRDRATALKARVVELELEKANIEAEIGSMAYATRGGGVVIDDTARQAAVAPIVVKIKAARAELEGLPEECRKAGCQPGWLR